MNGASLRQSIWVCTAILLTATVVATPVAAVEGVLVLYSFGKYSAHRWLLAFCSGLTLGVAYQAVSAYNVAGSADGPD